MKNRLVKFLKMCYVYFDFEQWKWLYGATGCLLLGISINSSELEKGSLRRSEDWVCKFFVSTKSRQQVGSSLKLVAWLSGFLINGSFTASYSMSRRLRFVYSFIITVG
jgi:hypothetical protein